MTRSERRLAGAIVAAWMLLSFCTSALRIGGRVAAHQQIYVAGALFLEVEWLLQAGGAALFAVYMMRHRAQRFRFAMSAAVATIIFLAVEMIDFGAWYVLRPYLPSRSMTPLYMLNGMLAIDVTHFFILILGTAAAVLMIDAYHHGLDAEREASQLEARLSEVRLKNLRHQVQPAQIRKTLAEIEAMLPHDAARAESELLNLSDSLRVALLHATPERHVPEVVRT